MNFYKKEQSYSETQQFNNSMERSDFSPQLNNTSERFSYFNDRTYSSSVASVQSFSREVIEAANILCSMRSDKTTKYDPQWPTVIFHKSFDNPMLGKRSIAIINNPANENQPAATRLSQAITLEGTLSMSYKIIRGNDKGYDKIRKAKARYESSDKGKETKARYEASDKGKKTRAKYRASDQGKLVTYRAKAKYYASVKGKAKKAIYRAKLMAYKKARREGLSEKSSKGKRGAGS